MASLGLLTLVLRMVADVNHSAMPIAELLYLKCVRFSQAPRGNITSACRHLVSSCWLALKMQLFFYI